MPAHSTRAAREWRVQASSRARRRHDQPVSPGRERRQRRQLRPRHAQRRASGACLRTAGAHVQSRSHRSTTVLSRPASAAANGRTCRASPREREQYPHLAPSVQAQSRRHLPARQPHQQAARAMESVLAMRAHAAATAAIRWLLAPTAPGPLLAAESYVGSHHLAAEGLVCLLQARPIETCAMSTWLSERRLRRAVPHRGQHNRHLRAKRFAGHHRFPFLRRPHGGFGSRPAGESALSEVLENRAYVNVDVQRAELGTNRPPPRLSIVDFDEQSAPPGGSVPSTRCSTTSAAIGGVRRLPRAAARWGAQSTQVYKRHRDLKPPANSGRHVFRRRSR